MSADYELLMDAMEKGYYIQDIETGIRVRWGKRFCDGQMVWMHDNAGNKSTKCPDFSIGIWKKSPQNKAQRPRLKGEINELKEHGINKESDIDYYIPFTDCCIIATKSRKVITVKNTMSGPRVESGRRYLGIREAFNVKH